jgi:hypothetical protein
VLEKILYWTLLACVSCKPATILQGQD